MGSPATVTTVLRTQGLQFVRLFQGAMRLVSLYSTEHPQAQTAMARAMVPLLSVLKETATLTVGFQFDNVLLNSVVVQDSTLAPLAGELAKRRVGFLIFSEGITIETLAQMLSILATKPEVIEEHGGLPKLLRSRPLEHARIVAVQMAAAEGSLAVVTSAEEAAAMAKIPRWLLRALHEVHSGGTQIVGAVELASLAETLTPDLTLQQRLLLPQLQDLLVRVVQRANTVALAELVRSAAVEIGGAGEELLQSVLLQGLTASIEQGEVLQAERILRIVTQLRVEPETLLQKVPADKLPEQMRAELMEYIVWLHLPLDEQLARLSQEPTSREFRWLVLEIENHYDQQRFQPACDLLLALFTTTGPVSEAERAEALTRGRFLLAELCIGGLPHNAQSLMDDISLRLREETSPVVTTPLLESVAVLTQAAAEKGEYGLANAGASVIAEIAEEFSTRGRQARQVQAELLKPSTLSRLVKNCVLGKDDPAVARSILPLLKKVGDQAARELLQMLEREPVAARRMRVLQVVKLLGKAAADALSGKISDSQWYVVRNAVAAIGELADPALLDRLEPALSHPDERVQQAAVSAALKTRSPHRGLPLARALPALKPSVLETVLDDLLVLKDPETVPHLEKLLCHPADECKPQLLQKAVAALWSVGTEEAAHALANSANAPGLARPVRQAALRALARLEQPAARQILERFADTASDATLAAEARKLLG